MIFRDPMTSLNPYAGEQLMEVLMLHKGLSKAEAFEESVKMLDAVNVEARKRMKMFRTSFPADAPARDDCHGAAVSAAAADCG